MIIPLLIAADACIKLSVVAAVGENLSVFDAFRRAWKVFRNNLGAVIVMALILGFGGLIVGTILAIPFLAVFVPFIIGLLAGSEPAVLAGLVVSGLLFFVVLPVMLILFGILNTFLTGAWTLTFRRLAGNSGPETALAKR